MRRKGILMVALMLVASIAQAHLYRYTDAQGNVHYTDTPPPEVELQAIEGTVSVYQAPDLPVQAPVEAAVTGKKKKVVMYSASWCGICKSARNYMRSNNIRFTEYDIETSEKGRKDYAKFGGKGVPVIFVGEQRMNGFTAGRLEKMLD